MPSQTIHSVNTKLFFSRSHYLPLNNLAKLVLFRCDFDSAYYQPELYDINNIKLPLSIQNSVKKRQAEYLAGRYAAAMALKKLGFNDVNVPTGNHRSPIWPDNIIASITHNNNSSLCVAAYKQDYIYLGLDIENWIEQETIHGIKSIIIQSSEEVLLHHTMLDFNKAFTLAFSAKESLFKALYPKVGYYFDFSAAEITNISVKNKTFELTISQDLTPQLTTGTRFEGTFLFDSTSILTLIQQSVEAF